MTFRRNGRSVVTGLGAHLRATATRGFRALPPRWRERVKGALGALGHDPGWAQRLRARRLAETTKRLDRWAPETARLLRIGGIASLEGRDCLEFGSGHLLAEPLIYHLLGASRVVAVDHFAILEESIVGRVWDGIDEDALVAVLGSFEAPDAVRRRLLNLRALDRLRLRDLAPLGITYVAPFDVTRDPPPGRGFDAILSCSVLEHVPAASAPAILGGLAELLKPGGVMIHAIHLEDHRDFAREPFAFLAAGTDWTEAEADRRGNRLRASEWLALAGRIEGVEIVATERERRDAPLPPLDPRFLGFDPEDLRTKGLVLAARRVGTDA